MRWIAVLIATASLTAPLPALADGPSMVRKAQALWVRYCDGCHGLDGRSDTPAGQVSRAPDLTQSKMDAAALKKAIVEVPHHSLSMQHLSDEDVDLLAALVQALRAQASAGQSKPPDS